MKILGVKKIIKFKQKYAQSRKSMDEFVYKLRAATWKNTSHIKSTFRNFEKVGGKYVIDVGGNKYRVVIIIVFIEGQVKITDVLTHNEYDKGKWK
ncbi:MAG: type II toxin-antitoxin system HigB family toxin [Bacteroidetes bacterium]|nr:type II toxin-antitoxin system HigB family toxin [Bacteroidota bacterium]